MTISSSIVLCTFNGTRYLGTLWQSLLAQTRLPDEIVVRDDVSSDDTLELLARLQADAEKRSIRTRILRNEKNLGYVANFETALRDATGDVVFLCDQDDVWHPGKLAMQLEAFEQRAELLLLCGDARRVDAAGRTMRNSLFDVLRVSKTELAKIHGRRGFEVLLRRSLCTGATVALRRRLIAQALPFPDGWVHDEWLAIVAAARGGFDCVETALVDYRQHGGNQLGMPDRGLRDKCRDMLDPQAAAIDKLVARAEILLSKLDGMAGLEPNCRRLAADKLAHLRARRSIRGLPWRRAGKISTELFNGRYGRYSSGWRSAMRDLLRHR